MTQRNSGSPELAQGTLSPAKAPAGGVNEGVRVSEGPATAVPIPRGGGRLIVERDGDRTTFTSAPLPPQFMTVAHRAQETAFGLMGMLVVIVILGPFARMWARRLEKRPEMNAAGANTQLLQKQLLELQQSVDAMSVEVERIGESQRFQAKLLYEKQSG